MKTIADMEELQHEMNRRAAATINHIVQKYRDSVRPVQNTLFDTEPCEHCGGLGFVDSGGSTPWGEQLSIPCGCENR